MVVAVVILTVVVAVVDAVAVDTIVDVVLFPHRKPQAGIKRTDLSPERVMEGRITDGVDIESVKVGDPTMIMWANI